MLYVCTDQSQGTRNLEDDCHSHRNDSTKMFVCVLMSDARGFFSATGWHQADDPVLRS